MILPSWTPMKAKLIHDIVEFSPGPPNAFPPAKPPKLLLLLASIHSRIHAPLVLP